MELLIDLVWKYQRAQTDEERNRYASEIVERIYPRLSRFIRSRVKPAIMEDVLQEIFKAIFKRLSYFRGQTSESVLGWIYTIARRQAAESFRGRKINQATVADPKVLEEALAPVLARGLLSQADLSDLNDAIEVLKAADYPCLGWLWDRFVNDLSFVEMAREAGINTDAMRKRVTRCLALAGNLINR